MWLLGSLAVLLGVKLGSCQFLDLPEYLQNEYQRAFTAYGPGLAVFTPYSYVDMFYDNLPFVGKIPVFGKDGTSSRLGISPFYPIGGNPSNPVPPIYRARPLPIHAPNPVEVVAVPLDEEALHGEPLFPKELVLPEEMEMAVPEGHIKNDKKKPENPFGGISGLKPITDPFDGVDGTGETLPELGEDLEKAVVPLEIGDLPGQSGNKEDNFGEIIAPGAIKALEREGKIPKIVTKTKRPLFKDFSSEEYEDDDNDNDTTTVRPKTRTRLNVLRQQMKA